MGHLGFTGHFETTVKYSRNMSKSSKASGLPFPAVVVIAALAVFGVITIVQWLVSSLTGILKFGLFVLIVVAMAGWVVNVKGKR